MQDLVLHSKNAKKGVQIQNFQQGDEETLYEAWECYKRMLQTFPQHDLNNHKEGQTFYNCLDTATRKLKDIMGPIPKRLPTGVKETIQDLAQHSHWLLFVRDPSIRKKKEMNHSMEMNALIAKTKDMGKLMRTISKSVIVIQIGFDNYNGPILQKSVPKIF